MKTIIAYKCIPKGMVSHGHKWVVGKWYSWNGTLKMCPKDNDVKHGFGGFHASRLLSDAFNFVAPYYVCKVEAKGEIIEGEDKFVASHMRVVKAYRWSKNDSVTFCVSLKERMCRINPDKRVRLAFKTAEDYLKNPCKKTKDAARAAAGAAASAERAAERAAARAAEWAAARAAEWAAASAASAAARAERAAARAAGDAASDAEKMKKHRTILKILRNKDKQQGEKVKHSDGETHGKKKI